MDMSKFHKQRSPDEFLIPQLEALFKDQRVQSCWDPLVTVDPMGMFASRPTMSATTARMMIPELTEQLQADDIVVNSDDKSINVIKMAIDHVWNLPALAVRLGMNEDVMRKALSDSCQHERLVEKNADGSYKYNTYLPSIGGVTVYFIGDANKLRDPSTQIAVRCHDGELLFFWDLPSLTLAFFIPRVLWLRHLWH